MKIATWNVNSIAVRLSQVLTWLADNPTDVLCLQEIKCVDEKFPAQAFAEAGYIATFYGQPSYNGVAFISKSVPQAIERGFDGDLVTGQRRFIAATFDGVRVINTYFPNGQAVDSEKFIYKLGWMKNLRAYLDVWCDASSFVALCGDYNIAPDDRDVYDPVAWAGQIHCSPPERAALQEIKDWGLVDTFRQHQSEGGFYSWWNYREGGFRKNQGLRIDHIWVSPPLAEKCVAAWIDKIPRAWERPSDHTPVVAEFAL
ncbi:MAG TPA: exodeoxyribonuclease III [Blastocatellia bacterium]|nr:exodeoxyribonuclease III [Blastocatellia bacterium]